MFGYVRFFLFLFLSFTGVYGLGKFAVEEAA